MLTIFRLHIKSCIGKRRQNDRAYRRCKCPIHVEGMCGGKYIRQGLKTADWNKAQGRVADAEARDSWDSVAVAPNAASKHASGEMQSSVGILVTEARKKFLLDAEHGRKLSERTIEKYLLLLRQLEEFCEKKGISRLKEVNVDLLREFREGWRATRTADLKAEEKSGQPRPLAARTAMKRLELLKSFFRFALDSGWIDKNPTKPIRAPKPKESQKIPFSPAEMDRIYEACGEVNLEGGVHSDPMPITNDKLLTFTLLLRYSGLRIGDAVMLTIDRIWDDQKLYLYTQKGTGTHVCVPLPVSLIERLERITLRHGKYFFLGPESMDVDVAAEVWRRKLDRVFLKACVLGGYPHRFRHTFAVELLKAGAKLENVSMLLGHSSIRITQKHYAAWVKDRQDLLEAEVAKTWGNLAIVKDGLKKAS